MPSVGARRRFLNRPLNRIFTFATNNDHACRVRTQSGWSNRRQLNLQMRFRARATGAGSAEQTLIRRFSHYREARQMPEGYRMNQRPTAPMAHAIPSFPMNMTILDRRGAFFSVSFSRFLYGARFAVLRISFFDTFKARHCARERRARPLGGGT